MNGRKSVTTPRIKKLATFAMGGRTTAPSAAASESTPAPSNTAPEPEPALMPAPEPTGAPAPTPAAKKPAKKPAKKEAMKKEDPAIEGKASGYSFVFSSEQYEQAEWLMANAPGLRSKQVLLARAFDMFYEAMRKKYGSAS